MVIGLLALGATVGHGASVVVAPDSTYCRQLDVPQHDERDVPKLQVSDSDRNALTGTLAGYAWVFQVPLKSGSLTTTVLLDLRPLPEGCVLAPIEIDLPFSAGYAQFPVDLAPVKRESGGGTLDTRNHVDTIYAAQKNFEGSGEITVHMLFLMYQVAHAVAPPLMRADWDNQSYHAYTIRAAYAYLKSILALTHRTWLRPSPGDVNLARDYLIMARSNEANVVKNALEGNSVDDLIRDLDGLEGWRFARLWSLIADQPCSQERIKLLQEFKEKLEAAGTLDASQRKKIELIAQVTGSKVQEEIDTCQKRASTPQSGS
jgi:hypothetical protein